MASPTAMAKCLRADAKLILSEHAPAYSKYIDQVVEDTLNAAREECARRGFLVDDFKAVLMLAAAAALEVEGE